MKNKSKLRLSYSLLQCWLTGDYEQCALMYQHRSSPTGAQEDGLAFHEKWEKEIKETKKLKIKDRVFQFKDPKVEYVGAHEFSELSIVKGRLDCLDDGIVWEFKSGVTSSLEYAQKDQIPFYFMLLKMEGIIPKHGTVIHYNQNSDEVDVSKVYYSEELVDSAINLCQTYEHEIYEFFDSRNIL